MAAFAKLLGRCNRDGHSHVALAVIADNGAVGRLLDAKMRPQVMRLLGDTISEPEILTALEPGHPCPGVRSCILLGTPTERRTPKLGNPVGTSDRSEISDRNFRKTETIRLGIFG